MIPGILLCLVFFSSCSVQKQKKKLIENIWENDSRYLEFSEDAFVIINKDSNAVVGFRGTFRFSEHPSNAFVLAYQDYLDVDGQWYSLEGTDLENYEDYLLFQIQNDKLVTHVIGNNTTYSYRKVNKTSFQESLESLKQSD